MLTLMPGFLLKLKFRTAARYRNPRSTAAALALVVVLNMVLVAPSRVAWAQQAASPDSTADKDTERASKRKKKKAKGKKDESEQESGIERIILPPMWNTGAVNGQGAAAGKSTPTATQQVQKNLQSEPVQMSNGAIVDLEIQQNSQALSASTAASFEGGATAPAAPQVDPPDPLAPALNNTFEAINFNENTSLTGFFQIPPDPAGAAGTTHVVNVVNSSIEWYTKTGTRQNRQSLTSFFATAPTPPQTGTFDPKVVYDHYSNRFIVVTMERIEASGPTLNQSRVYLAVSDDSDPNGTWYFQTLLTEETINTRQCWADFPGLAFDSEAVYFTTNMFAHNNQTQAGVFQGQRLWIMQKTAWYAGLAPVATRYNPTGLANANPNGTEGAVATTMQPTIMYGDTPGGLGTFLIAYSGLSDGVNNYVQIIEVTSPLAPAATDFTVYFSLVGTRAADDATNLALPSAPQLGTSRTIATNDRRFSQHGVHRNGLLYCAAPFRPPAAAPVDAAQTTVHWFVLNPAVLNTSLADPPPTNQGNVGGEDIAPNTHTFFPTVAVDLAGNLAIGFAASGPNIFAGAYFTGRLASDAPGTTMPAGGLRAGRDIYVRAFSTSMTVTSRWGDYTGIALDPADNSTFWVFNEYALPRGTVIGSVGAHEQGRWGNAWGSFSLSGPATTPAGAVIISEFRLSGPAGAEDEFIEIYNNTDATLTVEDINPLATGTSGWAIVSSDNPAVAKAVVPTGTTIPARGHYLIANNTATTGYSLSAYPAGHNGPNGLPTSTTATPDRTYTTNIPADVGLALFRSANPLNFTLADRLDAVGPTSEVNTLFKEGPGYPAVGPTVLEHSFYRSYCPANTGVFGSSMGCTAVTGGLPKDTDNNANDFVFVDTAGTSTAAGTRLGAPGPENLSAPIQRNSQFVGALLDNTVSDGASPNRARDTTPDSGNNSTFGTLDIRRRIVNNTGAPVTRLRFRIIDVTTRLSPGGIADLRARTSPAVPGVTINDIATCAATGTPTTAPCTVTVQGTTLESPPTQALGGAFNSSLSVGTITLSTPLAAGGSVNVRFLLGVQQTGLFRFYVNVEALP